MTRSREWQYHRHRIASYVHTKYYCLLEYSNWIAVIAQAWIQIRSVFIWFNEFKQNKPPYLPISDAKSIYFDFPYYQKKTIRAKNKLIVNKTLDHVRNFSSCLTWHFVHIWLITHSQCQVTRQLSVFNDEMKVICDMWVLYVHKKQHSDSILHIWMITDNLDIFLYRKLFNRDHGNRIEDSQTSLAEC